MVAGRPAHRPHRHPADRRGPRARRGAARAPRRPPTSRACSSARWSAPARPPSWPASATSAELRDDLLEWDYGDYEGLTTPEIRERAARAGSCGATGCPGGETPDDVGARADRVIAEARCARDGDVALFAHGHILRVLAARWIGQPAALGGRLALRTAGVGRCGFERDVRVLTGWNI